MSGPNALAKFKNRLSRSFSGKAPASDPAKGSAPATTTNGSSATATNQPKPAPSSTEAAPQSAGAASSTTGPAPGSASAPTPTQPNANKGAATASFRSPPQAPPKDETPPEAAAGAHLPNYSSSARSLSGARSKLRTLYPAIEPYKTGTLKVSSEAEGNHEIYWELSGKEGGYPVVFLHGGPGGGCSEDDRRWFDPKHYQILTFDQRGSGKSTPAAELTANTTWHLVDDIERLRTEVARVDKWHVFGGSWGSTLSLAYAQKHPQRVSALILRGIFTLRRAELLFFYQEGTSYIWPEQHQPYFEHIPAAERGDIIEAYYKRLTSDDPDVRLAAARRWSTFENATSKLYLDQQHIKRGDDDKWTLQFARIESHFFQHGGWMDDGELLKPSNIAKIAHIPTVVVQGRYDVVCPAKTAWDLRNAWLQSAEGGRKLEFFIVPDAGHASKEPGIMDKLLYATDKFRAIGATPAAAAATSSSTDVPIAATAATDNGTAAGAPAESSADRSPAAPVAAQ